MKNIIWPNKHDLPLYHTWISWKNILRFYQQVIYTTDLKSFYNYLWIQLLYFHFQFSNNISILHWVNIQYALKRITQEMVSIHIFLILYQPCNIPCKVSKDHSLHCKNSKYQPRNSKIIKQDFIPLMQAFALFNPPETYPLSSPSKLNKARGKITFLILFTEIINSAPMATCARYKWEEKLTFSFFSSKIFIFPPS